MKKILFIIFIIVGIHSVSKAQLSITPRVAPAIPLGTVGLVSNTGLGFGLETTYAINDNFRVGVAVDYYQFKTGIFGINLFGIKTTVMPLTGTVQYLFPGERIRPYVGIEAGTSIVSINKVDINRNYFSMAPAVGVIYNINDRLDFFANAKYQTVYIRESIPIGEFNIKQNIHFLPINFGVSFKLQ
jgi:outer membrane protein W